MIEIPWKQLSADALQGLIEEYVTRDGTDYGDREVSLETKVAHVRRELGSGCAKVVYDPQAGASNIIACT